MAGSKFSRACSGLLAVVLLASISMLAQTTGGRLLGRISDPTGALLAGTKVTLTNEATGVTQNADSNKTGDYQFIQVPVGRYSLQFDHEGFKTVVKKGIVVEINEVVTMNMTMQIGQTKEVVEVTSEAPLVDTTSTQLGAVVNDRAVSQLPLNARDTYQFLQLQPGVQSVVGSSATLYYGSDKAGAVSVNGGRGRSNNFSVNGGDANDQFVNLPTVQPTPDSIQEFRVLTNTFDAEYGRNSGAVVNVVTKGGTNRFHGDVYEFFRNKVLNARGYFDTEKPDFKQNQFGGTIGGPIKKDRTFFFGSYEGRRIRQGISSPVVTVPTLAERNGDFSEGVPLSQVTQFSGTLNNANILNNRPGCLTALGLGSPIADGTPYASIFPTNQIPIPCMDPTARDLLGYVPLPNRGGNQFQSVPVEPTRGDQFTIRIDHRINDKQNLSAYYYFNDDRVLQPFANFQLAGANVPGFGSQVAERFQQWNISHTWTVNPSSVNEFRFTYMREGQGTFQHPQRTGLVQTTCPTLPASQCFTNPATPSLGITPGLGANREGLPFIQISGGFNIGNNAEGELPQVGNTFQWADNFTKVAGNHTMKFGGDIRRNRFDQTLFFDVSGEYFFFGSSNNFVGGPNLYPDYLLGVPDQYGQGAAQSEHVRSTILALFAQDSWKIKPNLTLNYGLRWELDTPLTDVSQHVQTFRPGENSQVYPCQLSAASVATFQSFGVANPNCANTGVTPTGLVVPGDPGIPPGMTQTYYKAFAPRIGLAWSPNADSGWISKLTGGPGKTSIRTGWGLFYNPIEQLVLEQFSAEPPFGGSTFVSNPMFNTPFLNQDGVTVTPNPFNGILNPPRGQPVDWSTFRPILLFGQFQPHMRTQYTAQYNLTIQREIAKDMVLQVGYVGSQGHRLLATHDLNPANPQTCLDINTVLGAGTCGPFLEDSQYNIPAGAIPPGMLFHLPNGQTVQGGLNSPALTMVGLRPFSSPNCNYFTAAGCPPDGVPVFSSVFAQDTIANSSYNSLQASLEKRFAHGLQFQAAYTWSKSFDEASSFEGILNPVNPSLSRALSLFDARNRFVFSYFWDLPTGKHTGWVSKLVDGWATSGILTLQSGFPIRITSSADNELMNSFDFELPGQPDQLAPFQTLNPRHNGGYWFNPLIFTENATDPSSPNFDPSLLGRIGNSKRTICCGPGIANLDLGIHKLIPVTESTHFEFRAEFFNALNHTQFLNPDGNSSDGTQFGQITQARDPRLVQFALKYIF